MTDWKRDPRHDDDPMLLGTRALQLLCMLLGLAFVLVCSLCAYGCSSPPRCPDPRQDCGHPIRVERVEIRCSECDKFLGGSECTRWDLRAR